MGDTLPQNGQTSACFAADHSAAPPQAGQSNRCRAVSSFGLPEPPFTGAGTRVLRVSGFAAPGNGGGPLGSGGGTLLDG
jgi:hypothetical protein